jgi:hypothetical protein
MKGSSIKLGNQILAVMVTSWTALAEGLPVITSQPQSKTTLPLAVTFTVVSTNATAFQWRLNGVDIAGATTSTLELIMPQSTDAGYYMAVVKNATGWVPSQLAYLPPGSSGRVPLSNQTNDYFQGQVPVNNALAQVVAGAVLDQMYPFAPKVAVENGYYGSSSSYVPMTTVSPGQPVYYRVQITDTSGNFITHSTVLNLTAGGGSYPVPSCYGLKFPLWWAGEGLEPKLIPPSTPTNQVRIPGETFSLTNTYFAYTDYGMPTAQWRKNGVPIPGATNFPAIYLGPHGEDGDFQAVLTLTNVQPADAGIYDLVVLGNDWIVGPKTTLSIQLANSPGVLLAPRISGSSFVCDLLGVAGRNYGIEWSLDLSTWSDLQTVSNASGTVTFTNTTAPESTRYYRSRLLP